MPGNIMQAVLECGCCGALYPCECRFDAAVSFKGIVTTSSGSVCEIDPAAGGVVGDPVANLAWNTEDCSLTTRWGIIRTADPPNCTEANPVNLTRRFVFCQKITTADAPYRDDAIVQQYDWYGVVYAAITDNVEGVYYDYEVCCFNETPKDPATSHLCWIKFYGVTLGGTVYTLIWYNITTAAFYGDCGFPLP